MSKDKQYPAYTVLVKDKKTGKNTKIGALFANEYGGFNLAWDNVDSIERNGETILVTRDVAYTNVHAYQPMKDGETRTTRRPIEDADL